MRCSQWIGNDQLPNDVERCKSKKRIDRVNLTAELIAEPSGHVIEHSGGISIEPEIYSVVLVEAGINGTRPHKRDEHSSDSKDKNYCKITAV